MSRPIIPFGRLIGVMVFEKYGGTLYEKRFDVGELV